MELLAIEHDFFGLSNFSMAADAARVSVGSRVAVVRTPSLRLALLVAKAPKTSACRWALRGFLQAALSSREGAACADGAADVHDGAE
ncbi:MAG TPA: hypothetical protein VJS67_09135 [Pseudonocardiaceae bacterium]|nr:hypothetical protein [Pseudonocardiaceae bacterium]